MRFIRIAVAVSLLSTGFAAKASAQESGIAVGARAPSALVHTLDGKSTNIGQWVGKTPMLIEFWAFWCPNCKELEPSLLALQKKYGSRMKFLGVAVSVNESSDRVKGYVTKRGFQHQTVFDADGKATEAYDVPATSYVVVVDGSGTVVYTGLGGKQQLEPAIIKALAK